MLDRTEKLAWLIREYEQMLRRSLRFAQTTHNRVTRLADAHHLSHDDRRVVQKWLDDYHRFQTYLLYALSNLPADDEARLADLAGHMETYLRMQHDSGLGASSS
jgi:hypothetical protein